MDNNILHIIIPFFNFSNTKLRKENLQKTLYHLKYFKNINIIIVEGVYQNDSLENEDFIKDFKYIKYQLPSVLWIKENLINLAIRSLPSNWEYVCWIDSDIIFLNQNWVKETIECLKKYDALQLYKTVIYLNENGDLDFSIDIPCHKAISHGYIYKLIQEKRYIYGPTGFGWGINKKFYQKINKFFEFSIIGGGDFIFAICATQSYEDAKTSASFKNMPSENYFNKLISYYHLFKDCKTYYINGLICHLWHGNLNKRQYESRWNIVLNNKFDPDKDVLKTNDGVIYLSNESKNLEKEILEYFQNRKD